MTKNGMALADKVRWALLSPGDKVLVAVSGGPDSLCLLHLLWTHREACELGGVEAAHLDHQFRGEESAAEAAWVAAWCAERGVVCHMGREDVAAQAQRSRQSKQQAAREARYAFLAKTAEQSGATKIATGHTRNDQVETVLVNILRGTGTDGLRGIPERRGVIVRPLLDISRAEIEAYCTANTLLPQQDPSNFSSDYYTRNRIRLELLPQLRREYNAGVDKALLRLSEIAGRDSDYLTMQAEAALQEATFYSGPARLALDTVLLRSLHPALLRYVLLLALKQVRGSAVDVTNAHLEQLCSVVAQVSGSSSINIDGLLPRPGCTISVSPTVIRIDLTPSIPATTIQAPIELSVPGKVLLESGWSVQSEWEDHAGAIKLDADALDIGSLTVRTRRTGDRIDPLGMGGQHKKVSDIFTDAKLPHSEREHIPIIADAQGIVWVAGYTLSERAKVTLNTTRVLYLSVGRIQLEAVLGD